MVLLGTNKSSNTISVCKGPVRSGLKIEACNNLTLETLFFNLCKACQLEIMASIPPSAFSAGRIRETQRDMKISNTNKRNESPKFFNKTMMELTPLKYNSKLMNSIWGFYNRYSPHNVKKVNDANIPNAALQPTAANPNNMKNESMISLSSAKLDNVWTFNVSSSH